MDCAMSGKNDVSDVLESLDAIDKWAGYGLFSDDALPPSRVSRRPIIKLLRKFVTFTAR